MSIRVLIVDDSRTMCALLRARLADEKDIEVIASAGDAMEARKLIKKLNPDVVTLDIEMPGMDGLDFLDKIMALRPTPVIIVSGSTQEGSEATARALRGGAVSCFSKGDCAGALPVEDRGKLAQLIRDASKVSFGTHSKNTHAMARPTRAEPTRLIAIGSSTGGVEALRTLIPECGEDCAPTLIVQHVNARFSEAIAQSLNEMSPANVKIAVDGTLLKRGHVYFAPGGEQHMTVGASKDGAFRLFLRKGDLYSGHRPSVDILFHSVAKLGASNMAGVLLSGMGSDGAKGLLAMKQAGALTIAQDEASSVVFGMPRAAISLGAADVVAPLGEIAGIAFQGRAA